jgi:pimeloyl-ACP methyl ester carboxylesterase
MTDFVLVHGGNMTTGTWNRLSRQRPVTTPDGTMGGRVWDPVAEIVRKQGHRICAPALGDEHTTTLSGHIRQIASLLIARNLRRVVLAGHSYGGMVITGAAAQVPDRVRHLVYIDAALPDPGQSLFDLIRETGCDPLSFAGLEPAPPYTETVAFDPSRLRHIGKTYVRCTKSEFSAVTRSARQKIAPVACQWDYRELPSSHVPMAEMPERVAAILLAAARV